MSDPRQKLTPTQVTEAGLADWRQLRDCIRARFRTGDFATGLALVDRIGQAAEASNHHPDVTLTYPEVVVSLSSHDVGGITSRDLALARQVSAFAAELGATADTSGLTQPDLGLDTGQPEGNAPVYAALLGAPLKDGEPNDPSGQSPTLWWQGPGESDEYALPENGVPQRWHLDVWVPTDAAEGRLQSVLDAGGRLISDAAAPSYWVVEDVDGNRSCICTVAGR